MPRKIDSKSDAVDEDWIREFVLSMVRDENGKISDSWCSEKVLLWGILARRRKDLQDANAILRKMMNLGLELCVHDLIPGLLGEVDYNLLSFANLRGYLDVSKT